MANHQFDLVNHPEWEITSSATTSGTRSMTPEEARDVLMDELAHGHDFIPFGHCDNFDFKSGCKGQGLYPFQRNNAVLTRYRSMASPANPIPPGANPGTRYGRYTVLSVMQPGRKARVLCRCVCGTEKEVRLDGLKAGKVMSCGCLNTERRKDEKPSMQGAFADVLQKRFGRLVATGIQRETGKPTKIVCRCDCGGQILTTAPRLRSGDTTSCGCFHQERLVEQGAITRDHGHAVDGELACGNTSIYRAWLKVRSLCRAVQRRGAGKVNGEYDPRWEIFAEFLADFGEIGFSETICRKDNSLPWSKSNCYVGLGPTDSRRNTREENLLSAQKSQEQQP